MTTEQFASLSSTIQLISDQLDGMSQDLLNTKVAAGMIVLILLATLWFTVFKAIKR